MKNLRFNNIFSRILITLCLMLASMSAWAADYVFAYDDNGTTYYMTVNNGALARTNAFNPNTCIWTLDGNQNLYIAIGGTTYYLGYNRSGNGKKNNPYVYTNWGISGAIRAAITINGTTASCTVSNGQGTNSTAYIRYTGSNFEFATANSSYAKAYAVTPGGGSDFSVNISYPTSGANIGQVGGTMNISAQVSGNYAPTYYNFNNKFYYTTNGTTYTESYSAPAVYNFDYTYQIISGGSYATISGNTVTYTTDAGEDVEVTVRVTANPQGYPGITKTAECTFTLRSATLAAPTITRIAGTNQYRITYPASATARYTTDGTDINQWAGNGAEYTDVVTVTTPGAVIKTRAVRDGVVSAQTEYTVSDVFLNAPVISIADDGTVTITNPNDYALGATIYYTTDGSEPMVSSSEYEGSFLVAEGAIVKAIIIETGYANSVIAENRYSIETGVSGAVVVLNDYEDHTWTYYTGVDPSVDGGNYNTNYLDIMYSPDPRNVKITYNGGSVEGASAVAISGATGEGQNTMIYYKTIEKHQPGETGDYAYHVIPNPFSKRPRTTGATGTDGYYGFGGWKLVSGGEYIQGYSNNDVLPLEQLIYFVNLPYPSVNCTSAEIVFEATWVPATVYVQANKPTFEGGTYETNFWVLNANPGAAVTLNQNMTFTQVTPDGGATADYRNNFTMTRGIAFSHGDGVTPKIEFMKRNNGDRFNPNGKNLFIGRGVTNETTSSFYATYSTTDNTNQTVRVESGNYGTVRHYNAKPSSLVHQEIIWGCDYDRARGVNTNLTITGEASYCENVEVTNDQQKLGARAYIKSGRFQPNAQPANGDNNLYYMGRRSDATKYNLGCRYLEIQGGELCNIAGGSISHTGAETTIAFRLRMKGGVIRGMAFGCARGNDSNGSRAFVVTGGTIRGWMTPGLNGTLENVGLLDGKGYLYLGGNGEVNSNGSTTVMNRSLGGNLFGAGSGYNRTSRSGGNTLGTNTVVADNGYVERGVYGGGSYGFCSETTGSVAYIYITGGRVGGLNGGVNGTTYDASIKGGVYGGSCQNRGYASNIYMTGGEVNGGIYGGSNAYGTMHASTNIKIVGGTVNGNVHGGGYGSETVVTTDVDINIGHRDAGTGAVAGDAVINGDVYGGSALGKVNGTAATNSYHTNVTLNSGLINGSLYGGALGDAGTAANVYGPVAVKVYGGTVNTTSASGSGAVYGANNINGAPQRAVTVDIYGTDPAPSADAFALDAVYGGGNQADYTYGNGYPKVTVHNCDNSIGYVYGGGNAAAVAGTDVTIWGGNTIGNVFGGGNGQVTAANVSGGTNVKIYGGTIGDVYGGSNTNGTIGGAINVTVDAQSENGGDGCAMHIGNVYGGGNKAASAAGNVDVRCTGEGEIDAVYGGANQADIGGDINLNITGGRIRNVFGGNNNGGIINGAITVTIDWENVCASNYIENVYGGGNKAPYTADAADNNNWPKVFVRNAVVEQDVFGGGLGSSARVMGNPRVKIGVGVGEDAGHSGSVSGHQVTIKGSVYGGGSAAPVTGNTLVEVDGSRIGGACTMQFKGADVNGVLVDKYVFGGGLGSTAIVTGNTQVKVHGNNTSIGKNVYGGGHGAAVTGNTKVQIGE